MVSPETVFGVFRPSIVVLLVGLAQASCAPPLNRNLTLRTADQGVPGAEGGGGSDDVPSGPPDAAGAGGQMTGGSGGDAGPGSDAVRDMDAQLVDLPGSDGDVVDAVVRDAPDLVGPTPDLAVVDVAIDSPADMGVLEDCGNSVDDDEDGFTDCADAECSGELMCVTPKPDAEPDATNADAEPPPCVGDACCERSCEGRDCGDDGCSGSCGDCDTGFFCGQAGQCVSEAPPGYVRIEPGVFTMGSPEGEPGRYMAELQHEVTLTRAFALKATEVTQPEWFHLMGTYPSHFGDTLDCLGGDCPVEAVNWYESVAYVNALSLADSLAPCYEVGNAAGTLGGGCESPAVECQGDFQYDSVRFLGLDCPGYRLPTEAEWEYAARAGTAGASYVGPIAEGGCEFDANLDQIGWYCGNSGERTHAVGGKPANAWGLYDMLGNVWEWNLDGYGDYPADAVTDPLGAEPGMGRVDRGGSWNSNAGVTRAAFRDLRAPNLRSFKRGLRPARSLP